MAARSDGYIRIARKSFAAGFWTESRVFSRWEAWVDLIQMAGFRDRKWMLPDGRDLFLARAETPPISIRFLAKRWGWSKQRADSFVRVLRRNGQIVGQQKPHQGYTYLIVNYDTYQGQPDSDEDSPKTEPRQRQDSARTKTNTGNTSKKVKTYMDDFEHFWKLYPRRTGGNPKAQASTTYAARRKEGVGAGEILKGLRAYVEHLKRERRIGSEFVKQAKSWLSPAYRGWEQDWGDNHDDPVVLGGEDFFRAEGSS